MKTIEHITEVKTYKYEAYDGTIFENRADCETYEKSYKCIMRKKFDAIPKVAISGVEYGIPYASDDDECYAMRFATIEALAEFKACLDVIVGTNYYTEPDPKHLNKTLLVTFGYDRDFCDIYVAEDFYKSAMDRLNAMKF